MWRVPLLAGLFACASSSGGAPQEEPVRDPAMLAALSRGVLVLANDGLDDAGLGAVLKNAPPLTEATLHGNALTAAGLQALLAHSGSTLTSLNVSSNPIGDAGLRALAAAPPPNLVALYVDDCGASTAGIEAIAKAGVFDYVRHWSLGRQSVGDDGARALVTARGEVHLESADLSATGAAVLLTAGAATSLHLDGNDLSGMQALGALNPELTVLTCAGCQLPGTALASAEAPSLLLLRLDGLGDADLEALAGAPWLVSLKALELRKLTASQPVRTTLREAWGKRSGLILQ